MMYSRILVLSLFVISLTLVACAGKRNKQLDAHYKLLSQTAKAKMPAEEKLDILATTAVAVMHEGVNVLDPKKGTKYVERFGNQNEENIYAILDEIGEWQEGLSTAQKFGLGLNMLQKPYVSDLVDLVPKFEQKYEQVEFVSRFSKRIKKEIADYGIGKLMQ